MIRGANEPELTNEAEGKREKEGRKPEGRKEESKEGRKTVQNFLKENGNKLVVIDEILILLVL